MAKRARVLWLTKGLGLGGVERLLVLSAGAIDRERFELHVAYLLPWKDAFVPALEDAGVRVTCLRARHTVDPRWLLRLGRLLRSGGYDLVHTHSPVPAVAARLLHRDATAVVHTEHNVWERYRWPTRVANAVTYPRNHRVIAVSEGVAGSITQPRWLVGDAFPPIETLHHGIDASAAPHGTAARSQARRHLGFDDEQPVIGTVANFTPKKDHAGLLDAFALLHRRIPAARLVLIGSGPLETELRRQVAVQGLTGAVRFLGPRSDVPDLLPGLDVFVLGSRYEGLAIALLEALAAGVPCVATRVGGIPEAVRDRIDGILVPPQQPDALAGAIEDLIGDAPRRQRLAANGRARVLEHFSISAAARRIESLYDMVLSHSGAEVST